MTNFTLRPDTLARVVRAVEQVKERLLRAVAALEAGGVPYAVVGGNAVAAWVAQIDEKAVRNTRDVDILIRREDLTAAIAAMSAAGFIHAEVAGVDLFIEGPTGKPSDGVHLIFAGERVRPEYGTPAATLEETEAGVQFRVVSLPALVRMKLESNRRKDQTHIIDMIHVGLIDHSWPERLPPLLADRLRELLNDPKEH
jgi:hypothetical protein